ncbi:MAG: biotin--[acetyl-CoA-carboxylase] ligase [Thermoleophilaceae bacterium]
MTALGRPWAHLRETDSTNERAKALARAGAPHGTIVTADRQSDGRGRQGRAWTAAAGSAVLMSMVVREGDERLALLPLRAAVAVCEAAEACVPARCRVKWPNDILIGDRKLAGILVEGRSQAGWAVVGIGLNVSAAEEDFPPELRGGATSLAIESPAEGRPGRTAALSALTRALTVRLAQEPEAVLGEWRRRDALRGSRIAWRDGEGTATGIDGEGALLVETASGTVTLRAGEVHLRLGA